MSTTTMIIKQCGLMLVSSLWIKVVIASWNILVKASMPSKMKKRAMAIPEQKMVHIVANFFP